MHLVQIGGSFIKIVQTDNSFGGTVPRNLLGNIILQINVVDAGGNGTAQDHQTLFLGFVPPSSIFTSTAGHHDRAWSLGQQSPQINTSADIVHAQLDDVGTVLSQMFVLGYHGLVATTTNGNAQHFYSNSLDLNFGLGRTCKTNWLHPKPYAALWSGCYWQQLPRFHGSLPAWNPLPLGTETRNCLQQMLPTSHSRPWREFATPESVLVTSPLPR